MSRSLLTLMLMMLMGWGGFSQRDEPVKLNRSRWEKMRKQIRYESSGRQGGNGLMPKERGERGSRTVPVDDRDGEWRRSSGGGRGGNGSGDSDFERVESRKSELEPYEPDTSSDSNSSFELGEGVSTFLAILLIAAVVGVLLWVIIKNGRRQESKVTELSDEVGEEQDPTEVPVSELELALREALAKNDFRMAVRVYFIFILKYLGQRNLIEWDRDKTNYDYINELLGRGSQHMNPFSRATKLYEYVWYGKHQLNEDQFNEVRPDLQKFVNEIEL